MTYKQSLYFTFDGVDSSEFNILNVHTSSGMFEEQFLPTRNIVEEKTAHRHEPYFFGYEYEPIEFSVEAYLENGFQDDDIKRIKKWLFKDGYKPFNFSDEPSKIYYCTVVSTPSAIHNGCKEGYLKIDFRCNSPFIYSPVYSERITVDNSVILEIENNGDLDIYPIITIQKNIEGNVSIKNLSDGGNSLVINNLTNEEIVEIDCENEIIETDDVSHFNLHEDISGEYVKLVTGVNRLEINGSCLIEVVYQEKSF